MITSLAVVGVQVRFSQGDAARDTATKQQHPMCWRVLVLLSACVVGACGNESTDGTSPTLPGGAAASGGQTGGGPSGGAGTEQDNAGSGGEDDGAGDASAGGGVTDAGGVSSSEPDAAATPVVCTPLPNDGSLTDADVNIDFATELQRIAGFGGMDGGFYAELTPEQVDTAFGNEPGQIGMSIMRIRIPETENRFNVSVAAAARAVQLGATVMATPWSPPAEMKSNGSTVAGSLNVASYGAYADHLLAFRDFMQSNGVPLYAMSVQNEPDIEVTYESCDWTPNQLIDWITAHGAKFGDTKLMAPESFNFNRTVSDPILNDPEAEPLVDIVGGHVYGGGLTDYPLAREKGKEVWMTEHYTDSANPANLWPLALGVATDIHNSMSASFSAYVWWAIRRAYGLITEDGLVSKRGYLMAQYAKFIRPGFVRVSATQPASPDVGVTAYKGGSQLVVVAINRSTAPQTISLDVFNGCATELSRFTTSEQKNVAADAAVTLVNGRAEVTLDAQSATTFVSQ
jgi:glucuronoarabinoxylan endo-1,4-beta-xylanase